MIKDISLVLLNNITFHTSLQPLDKNMCFDSRNSVTSHIWSSLTTAHGNRGQRDTTSIFKMFTRVAGRGPRMCSCSRKTSRAFASQCSCRKNSGTALNLIMVVYSLYFRFPNNRYNNRYIIQLAPRVTQVPSIASSIRKRATSKPAPPHFLCSSSEELGNLLQFHAKHVSINCQFSKRSTVGFWSYTEEVFVWFLTVGSRSASNDLETTSATSPS